MKLFTLRLRTVLLVAVVGMFVCTASAQTTGKVVGGYAPEPRHHRPDRPRDSFTDERDGREYRTVKMPDGKVWMAQNLNYKTPDSWCYGDNIANCEKYGRLYSWKDARTVCPSGFHLPSRKEWGDLARATGGTGTYGDGETAGKALKSASGWVANNGKSGNGTDEYGFAGLPGDHKNNYGGGSYAGKEGIWWTATEFDGNSARVRKMFYNKSNLEENFFSKGYGVSVRCVSD